MPFISYICVQAFDSLTARVAHIDSYNSLAYNSIMRRVFVIPTHQGRTQDFISGGG